VKRGVKEDLKVSGAWGKKKNEAGGGTCIRGEWGLGFSREGTKGRRS